MPLQAVVQAMVAAAVQMETPPAADADVRGRVKDKWTKRMKGVSSVEGALAVAARFTEEGSGFLLRLAAVGRGHQATSTTQHAAGWMQQRPGLCLLSPMPLSLHLLQPRRCS